MTGLSDQQAHILKWLLAHAKWEGPWGVRWRLQSGHYRTEAASISRAVKRLEARGLLIRNNEVSGPAPNGWITKHRTTHLKLTDAGRAEAERLTNFTCNGVNQDNPCKSPKDTVNKGTPASLLTDALRSGRASP